MHIYIFFRTFAARNPTKGCLHISGGFCRHIKKAFIALCSDTLKSRKFQYIQDLATIDVLRDIDYPSCAYFFGTSFAYIRMRMRVPLLRNSTRVYFIFGVGFALSVLNSKAMRQPHNVELAKGKFRAFFAPYSLSMGVIRPIGEMGLMGVIKMTIK